MATLAGNSIASTYTMLLKMDATGVTSSLQKIEDGDATDSALSVSTIAAALDATDKFYFDGGSDTYIFESGADVLDIFVGGANMIKLTESTTDTVLVTGDLTVGVDGTGHDVTFFSDTASAQMKWNDAQNTGLVIGADGTGSDVKFFGDTSGAYMLWDQSADDLILAGAAGLDIAGDIDVDGTANLDNTDIDGTFTQDAGNVVFNEDSGDYDFRVESNGNANMLFVDGGNNRVGIGTGSPDVSMDIMSSDNFKNILLTTSKSDDTDQYVGIAMQHETAAEEDIALLTGDSQDGVSIMTVGGGQGVYNAFEQIRFFTAATDVTTTGTERMRITNAGNVCIGGTTDEGYNTLLNIEGAGGTDDVPGILFKNTSASNDEDIMALIATQGTDSVGAITIKREGNADDAYIDFLTQANSGSMAERMRIDSSGNVGIGATSPTSPNSMGKFLHIKDGDHCSIVLEETSVNTYEMYVNAGNFRIADGTDIRLNLDANGNLGLGDDTPSEAKLSITGVASGDYGIKIDQDQASSGLFIAQDGAAPAIEIDTAVTNNHAILVNSPLTQTGCAGLLVNDCDALTTGSALQIQCAAGSLATTAAAGLAMVNYTGNSTATSNLMYLKNDDAAADDTVGLYIHQDGDDAHIEFAGAGGGGIKFAADISSSDSDTLDDYEEGTFTVTFGCQNSGTITVGSDNTMKYTKIGNVCHVSGRLDVDSVSSPTGTYVSVGNLPFASADTADKSSYAAGSLYASALGAALVTAQYMTNAEATSLMYIFESDGQTADAGHCAHWQADSYVSLQLTYFIS